MIRITPAISLDENEIQLEFVRSPGPGGQNVNKVASAVQLRFNVNNSPSLPEDVRQRLKSLAHSRINEAGELIIEAHRYRNQVDNRRDATERLSELIRRAAKKPAVRHPTRPTLASKKRRLESKRHRSEIKKLRTSKPELND